MSVTGDDLNACPVTRPGELLDVLSVTQHSGEGKANQYFLRGFNLDHGTDIASPSTTCRSICAPTRMARVTPI